MYKALSAIAQGVKDVMPSGTLGLFGVAKARRRKIISFGKEQILSSTNLNLLLKVVVRQVSPQVNSTVLKWDESKLAEYRNKWYQFRSSATSLLRSTNYINLCSVQKRKLAPY